MALSTKYNPAEAETKWYAYWMEKGYFRAKPNSSKEPFTIVIPPPNVTGVLHMGHMLNNTIQDVLIRKARMEGKVACWVPGTDHASIATEARVVGMLREKGIKKSSLTRDEFLSYAWEWKEKYGGIILEQLKKLGASCDWDRTAFTMEPGYYKAVIRVFVDLYKKGFIYRGLRMINWDCEAKTAVSNEEVIYNEGGEKSILYSVKYQVKDAPNEWVVIATQRPETIMGDTAVAVNPTDDRHKHLIGKKVLVPFINREIPVIADDYVDKSFGTGCLKVTPAHDVNDYEIGLRHHLPIVDTINDDGTLNERCEISKFVGKDRFAVRKQIVNDIKEAGLLVKEEEFVTRIGRSERTNTIIEPKLSLQWFVKMKEISRRALVAVEQDEIRLHPAKFKNTYRHWMENVRDWCISRQLWWGHRIPAYYFGPGDDDFVVAESLEEAVRLASEKAGRALTGSNLQQDPDVLDTWASSWLWPEAVFDGFKDEYFDASHGKIIASRNADLAYFYPTQVLVTAPEILFFWVARMIIAGYEYMDEKPFEDVYLTGIVRDKLGRKMSKSLGNSPDPLHLIARYGADGVRTGMLFSSPAGNDLLFDEKLCEQGRNFANKIWNAFRLIKGFDVQDIEQPEENKLAIDWFQSRLNQGITELEDCFSKFRISDALMTNYKLVWDDFCSWYLEIIKPRFGNPIDGSTYDATIGFFSTILKLLHPFMPFISEELWHELDKKEKGCLIVAPWPGAQAFDEKMILQAVASFEIVAQLRNLRNAKGISPKEPLKLVISKEGNEQFSRFISVAKKLGNLSEVSFSNGNPITGSIFMVNNVEFTVPLEGSIDLDKEREVIQKELDYAKGFLQSVMKKLANEKFVKGAPAHVIEVEKKKMQDAEIKIRALEQSLRSLGR